MPKLRQVKIKFEGGSYVGEVLNGNFHGFGVINYEDAERYEGEFINDSMIGYGIYYTADGSRQEAQFRDGEANGYGVVYYVSGNRYEGEIQDDQHNGYGILYLDDGERYEGEFTKNIGYDGYGVYLVPNGDRYDGHYRKGYKDGYGLFYGSNGTTFYAYFNNGELDSDRLVIRTGVNAPSMAERDSDGLILINGTFTARSNSNVRESPDASSRRITTIAKGTSILVTGKVNGKNWYAVERGGNHFGYIWADLLKPNQPVREQPSQARSSQPLEETSSGTGFFVSKAGHVLTNAHVVEGCQSVSVQPIGAPRQETYVVSQDRGADLALLRSSTRPSHTAIFRNGKSVRVGNDVIAFGFPLSGLLSDSGNLTKGSITALSGLGDSTSQVQISAPVQAGNSGGPLIDYSGNVVGVVVSKLSALKVAEITGDLPQNINFAIKRRIVEAFLDSHDVDYLSAQSLEHLDAADIAEAAKKYTVRVLCWD